MDAFQEHMLDKENLSLIALCNQGQHNVGHEFVSDVSITDNDHGSFIRQRQHGQYYTADDNNTNDTPDYTGRSFSCLFYTTPSPRDP